MASPHPRRRVISAARVAALRCSLSWLALVALTGCSENLSDIPGARGDYLAGKRPTRATGMSNTERMTDALAAIDGDNWQTDITTAFGRNGEAVWDLEDAKPIVCAYLQGDNNDSYFLEGSENGESWSPIWTAEPLKTPGMQARVATSLNARARYVKLHATGGDGLYSVSELALYGSCDPRAFPAHFEQRNGVTPSTRGTWALPVILAAFLVIFFGRRQERAPSPSQPLDMTRPTGIIVLLSGVLMDVWPLAVFGLALVSWPLVLSVFESPRKAAEASPSDEKTKASGRSA